MPKMQRAYQGYFGPSVHAKLTAHHEDAGSRDLPYLYAC